jgi:hypothetical protein
MGLISYVSRVNYDFADGNTCERHDRVDGFVATSPQNRWGCSHRFQAGG